MMDGILDEQDEDAFYTIYLDGRCWGNFKTLREAEKHVRTTYAEDIKAAKIYAGIFKAVTRIK